LKYITGPIVKLLSKLGIHPNYITSFSVITSLVAGYFIYVSDFLLATIFIVISVFIDVLDGGVARYSGKVTKFGNYFDAMVDKYVEVIIYLGFALGGYPIEAIFALSGSFLLSYAKPRLAITIPIDNHDWPAIGERGDRLLVLICGMVLFLIIGSFQGYSMISIALYSVAVITYIGGIQRILYAKGLIDKVKVIE